MCEKIACFSTYSGFFGIPEFRTNFSPSDGKILLGQTDTLIRQRKLIQELIYPRCWLEQSLGSSLKSDQSKWWGLLVYGNG